MVKGMSSVRFLLVGVINTAVTYLSYAILVWVCVPWQVASPIGYALGMMNSYFMNKYWTFQDNSSVTVQQIAKFVFVNLISWGVSFLFLWLFIDGVGVDEILAQIPAMVFSLVVNYLGSRCLVFRRLCEKGIR